MKHIHYVNLGYPKAATTWLFENLIQYPGIDYNGIKENSYLPNIGYPLDPYINYYWPYNISLSFAPNQFQLDSKQYKDLNQLATHFSIVLRNPYQIISSLINRYGAKNLNSYTKDLIKLNFFDYQRVVARMISSGLTKPILVLYYDDIEKNPIDVLKTVINHLELPVNQDFFNSYTNTKINSTNHTQEILFDYEETTIINEWIDRASEYFNKNLEHWKR